MMLLGSWQGKWVFDSAELRGKAQPLSGSDDTGITDEAKGFTSAFLHAKFPCGSQLPSQEQQLV
jgi:hypothetical protein